jgi:hypothetical protein
VVVVDSEVPESGWVSIDLAGLTPAPVGLAAPSAEWGETREPWLAEAVPRGRHRSDVRNPPTKEPLTIARLEAWAERLRGSEPSAGNGFTLATTTEPIAAMAPVAKEPVPEPRPVRGIRPEDLVAVGRKPVDPAILPEIAAPRPAAPVPPASPKPALARPALKIVAGRSRFSLGGVPSSSGVRFILLCLAAFFLSAGAVHSYGRWKHSRAVVVPATVTPGAVIT